MAGNEGTGLPQHVYRVCLRFNGIANPCHEPLAGKSRAGAASAAVPLSADERHGSRDVLPRHVTRPRSLPSTCQPPSLAPPACSPATMWSESPCPVQPGADEKRSRSFHATEAGVRRGRVPDGDARVRRGRPRQRVESGRGEAAGVERPRDAGPRAGAGLGRGREPARARPRRRDRDRRGDRPPPPRRRALLHPRLPGAHGGWRRGARRLHAGGRGRVGAQARRRGAGRRAGAGAQGARPGGHGAAADGAALLRVADPGRVVRVPAGRLAHLAHRPRLHGGGHRRRLLRHLRDEAGPVHRAGGRGALQRAPPAACAVRAGAPPGRRGAHRARAGWRAGPDLRPTRRRAGTPGRGCWSWGCAR